MLNGEIIHAIESVAPPSFQEEWDNTGLQIGRRNVECTGVLVCVDVTPAVVDEAISLGCNLIISHHPLLFKGLKRITGSTPQEIVVMNAIAAGISIYSCHTSIDNAPGGVSYVMAERLGIRVLRALVPMRPEVYKLQVMVPDDHAESLRMALFDVGVGHFGHYDCCSYNVSGRGTFRALDGADPYVGDIGEMHTESETAVQVIVPAPLRARVEDIIREVHPYECPAYEWIRMDNALNEAGAGVYGVLDEPVTAREFVAKVKAAFGSPTARCSHVDAVMDEDTQIRRVALCGGSGSSFIGDAVAAGAQVYVTSDIRYHDFLDNASSVFLVDIGHYEAEECTKDIFYQIISQKFANFAVYKSTSQTNPIAYL